MMIRLKGKFSNLSLVQVYAPDSSRLDEESEDFYSRLQSLVNTIPKKDFVIVLGNFNAILGNDNSGNEDIMGKF
jgi:exonuclease III